MTWIPGSAPSTFRSRSSARARYFPEWLLERRKRAETGVITVVVDCYLAGVLTRRMGKLVKTLGIHSLSRSQVSRMAAELDEHLAQFWHRPLGDAGPFTFVAATSASAPLVRDRCASRVPSSVGDCRRTPRESMLRFQHSSPPRMPPG